MSGLGELAGLFLRLGVTSFGGPAVHIAMLRDEVVRRRGWVDDQRFLDMVGATSLIPGPNSTELAMHLGQERAGWRGLLVAGFGFIVPAVLVVLGLAVLYDRYGTTPAGTALLYGVKPVIIAIVGAALLPLTRAALRRSGLLVAVAACALFLAGVDELVLLVAGGLAVLAVRTVPGRPGARSRSRRCWRFTERAADGELLRLFGLFLRTGAVLYGSGYVLPAFLRADLVDRLGWLSDAQLLDAVAIGQFTPGPVFTTATFVGYLVAGLPGAVLATVGIFAPSFAFVAVLGWLLPRVRDREWSAALLDGVNGASLGLMAGVLLQLGSDVLGDPLTALVAVVAALLLWRTNLNSAWLVAGGAVTGVLAGAVG